MPCDYFYNRETEQYIHYTLPKLLFENAELNKLSINAKFLYAILLDKAKLSDKNGFTDEDGKVCVYYPQAKMAKLLHVERKQLYKYLNELDVKKGIGLIERKQKLGKGRTDCIYVKNFAKPIRDGVMSASISDTKYKYFCDDDAASTVRFNYYPLPKALFYDVDYAEKHPYSDELLEIQRLPSNAKMAYTYFLDLLSLSISKGKKDEYGRYYVICPEKDLQKLLGCCGKTVRQILNQLDVNGGVGLIERSADNPAIIYMLDYSAYLSLSGKSNDEKSTHQNEKSTHHQSEKNTHQSEKNTHQKEKSTHPIYNNPYSNNPDFIDTHSINQASASANANSNSEGLIDGLIDRTQNTGNEMSFSEMLKAIDFHDCDLYFPNETDFYSYYGKDYYDWNIITKCCTIPYWLVKNKIELEKVLRFVFGYDCTIVCNDGSEDKETKTFIDLIIKSLLKMLKNEFCILNKQAVKYYQIIDIINKLMHDSSLMEWLDHFKVDWGKALSEYRPKNPEAYFKTCIWNSMNNFQFMEKFEDNNIFWQAGYDADNYYSKNSACSKGSDYESDSKYNTVGAILTNRLTMNRYEEIINPEPDNSNTEELQGYSNEFMVSHFLVYALKNNEPLRENLKDYSYPLPDGLTLDSPFDLTDEKLKELETKYGVSLISLRVQENENCNGSGNCDLETLNKNPLLPESIEPIEQSSEPRPEAAGTGTIPEADNPQYSDSFIITFLLSMAIKANKSLKDYLRKDYQYPLPNGVTFNSPNDLSAEKLQELEELYDVKLRY